MIESITLSDVASYTGPATTLNDLSQINFVYGSNGSGKTTISRVIADQARHPACTIAWQAGTPLQAMVYNRDFVERNFNQSTDLKGVFTLGENQKETLSKIAAAKADLDELKKKIESLTNTLQGDDGTSGKKGELSALENAFRDKCWRQKQKHDAKLQGAFEGYRGSADKFKAKVLQDLTNNSSTALPLVDLEKKCASVFGTTPTTESAIPAIDATRLIANEAHPILKKRVIGKEDVNIAAMIRKLENSDWVRQGRTYFDINEGACPFCQQSTNEAFANSLEEYFDETFVTDTKAIEDLSSDYRTDAERLQQQIIVGSLIKGLFDEVRSAAGHIKQVFVLTHNVYFHKEVTFNPKRTGKAMNEETFWVVRKADLVSTVERHDSNPIKTSYELLWAEVRRQDKSNLTIQNTLWRILENYFKILGGVDPDNLCAMFEGKERLICKSLFSWVNDGSHFAHDDLYIAIDDATVDNYLNVFRAIFEKAEHLAHYKMMMGAAYATEVVDQAEVATP